MSTTVDFMREIGAKDEDFTLYEPGQAHMLSAAASDNDSDEAKYSSGSIISCWPEYPELEGSTAVGRMIFSGSEMSTFSIFMHSKVIENSDAITYKLSAALTGLVQDESGAVVGAIYDDNGTSTRVKANKGVIMCCGGFERNAEMLQDYLSMPNAYHIAGSGNTGDGHLICAKLGAKFWHLNSMAGGPVRTAKGEILDLDGNAIPGLYSAGEFGSVWCDVYQGGGNLSERVNFARICVDSILG